MVRQAHGKWKGLALWLCLALMGWAVPAEAQLIGEWDGSFANLSGADYFEYPMDVPLDGTVVLTTAAASTLTGQYTAVSVYDTSGGSITFTYVMESPTTLQVPLAAGSFVVRIGRSFNNWYGGYHIEANLTPANGGATEIENNDLIVAASTNPNNLFAGAIGHWRAKDVLDLSDYYCFSLNQDTNVHFDLTTADTLVSSNTSLSLKNGSNTTMDYMYLDAPSRTWDLHLAAGTYYLRLYIADWSRYGGYNIATTTTPAVTNSSEIENNDTLAAANPIKSKTIFGSIGYYRDKIGSTEYYDNYDYFSCQVAQGGTLSIETRFDPTLNSFNNSIGIRDASNTNLKSNSLTISPNTVTVNNLAAGTYYIRVGRSQGYGAYQINVSGNVFLPSPGAPGSIIFPLLLSE
jgi:hypothetical protein